MAPAEIVYEEGLYWVARAKCGFEVFHNEGTQSVRCATIGFKGDEGLARAKREIARRVGESIELRDALTSLLAMRD